jgi:hypothetical protein
MDDESRSLGVFSDTPLACQIGGKPPAKKPAKAKPPKRAAEDAQSLSLGVFSDTPLACQIAQPTASKPPKPKQKKA